MSSNVLGQDYERRYQMGGQDSWGQRMTRAGFKRRFLTERQAQLICDRLGAAPDFEIVPHFVGQARDAEGRLYDTWKTGTLDRIDLRMTFDKKGGRGSALIASLNNSGCWQPDHIPPELERQRQEALALVSFFRAKRDKGSKVERARLAGESHAVLTVITPRQDSGGVMRQPCASCPWKRSSVGNFPAQAFIHSAPTAYDMATHTFGCHSAGQEHPKTCAGYVLRGAAHSLAGRLAAMRGEYEGVTHGGHDLFPNYRDMAEANGVAPEHPALAPIRTDF